MDLSSFDILHQKSLDNVCLPVCVCVCVDKCEHVCFVYTCAEVLEEDLIFVI